MPKFANMSDTALAAKMSQRLLWLEAAYDEAAERACKRAGDDRFGEAAEIAMGFKKIAHSLRALHCDASVLGARSVDMPIAPANER